MADLFAEVDEDVRAERARAAARRWAPAAAAAAVVAVVAVGCWQALLSHRDARDARLSGLFFTAQMAADAQSQQTAQGGGADAARALALFGSLQNAPRPGIRTLARLREAQLLGDRGDDTGAIRALDAVASDAAAPETLRQLATLLSVDREIAEPTPKAAPTSRATPTPEALTARLATLERPGAPFQALALEAGAMIALEQGRTDETRRVLSTLVADGEAPTGVRERASTLLQAIGAAAPGVRG